MSAPTTPHRGERGRDNVSQDSPSPDTRMYCSHKVSDQNNMLLFKRIGIVEKEGIWCILVIEDGRHLL